MTYGKKHKGQHLLSFLLIGVDAQVYNLALGRLTMTGHHFQIAHPTCRHHATET
jgi:flagellar basal body P-ring protein FlgI